MIREHVTASSRAPLIIRLAAGLLVFASLTANAGPQEESNPSPSSTAKKIDAIFAPLVTPHSPGVAVLVIKGGKKLFERGYGLRDLQSAAKIDPRTNFRLASCSKQFTAMAIMLLVHDGKLRYEQKFTDIFPDFPAYGRSITVRNLLNHTSGLPDYEDLLMKQYPNTPDEKIPQILDAGVLK